ncbi:hypothetical protein QCE63_03380 [Caballeronia sp. LZ065]|uniref:hypothetical protein n=1 Tax=Caballeronia sp. LZ065 TaxID=3038571 RepID=UPI00285F7F55|nr:hypothetical protein [Caballeronia sp. LZ065]MDR5778472.1 hypothetical protein [Caballeronia sp. LZ065]
MITEIPTLEDFEEIGIQLLNLAWDTAISLFCDLDIVRYTDVEVDSLNQEYWKAARTQLFTALSIAHQGSEFLLKGRIAEVSPFLLLVAHPRDWPKTSVSSPTPFSDFRSIDAQDLLKVHGSVRADPLSPDFVSKFEITRKTRNAIVHGVDRRLSIHASEILGHVLLINHALGREKNWVKVRQRYLENSPLSKMYAETYASARLVAEFIVVRDILSPSDSKRFFGFEKDSSNLICPDCAYNPYLRNDGCEPRTAMLSINQARSDAIWCFVCGQHQKIEWKACPAAECKGNVVSWDWQRCLTCGTELE